jgi:hypothetical protein
VFYAGGIEIRNVNVRNTALGSLTPWNVSWSVGLCISVVEIYESIIVDRSSFTDCGWRDGVGVTLMGISESQTNISIS